LEGVVDHIRLVTQNNLFRALKFRKERRDFKAVSNRIFLKSFIYYGMALLKRNRRLRTDESHYSGCIPNSDEEDG
jgi:hypothetical protein